MPSPPPSANLYPAFRDLPEFPDPPSPHGLLPADPLQAPALTQSSELSLPRAQGSSSWLLHRPTSKYRNLPATC